MTREQRTPLLSPAGADVSSTDWPTMEPDYLEAPRSPFDPTFEPEDYTTMLYNLHSWSYRVSRKEFQHYQQRRVHQLKHQFGFDDISHQHVSQTHMQSFRRQLSRTISRPYAAASHKSLARKQSQGAAQQSRNAPSRFRLRCSWWRRNPSSKTQSCWMGLPMLPATHKMMLAWAVLMLVTDLVYTALLLPLLVAFDLNSYGHSCFWVGIIVGWFFVGDFLVILHRGVVIRYLDHHMYVDLPLDVACLYIAHGSFWSDFIVAASIPLQMLSLLLPHLPAAALPHLPSGSLLLLLLKVLPLLRGLRLLRLLLLQRELFLGKVGLRHINRRLVWFLLSLAYVMLVLLNWLACIMIFLAHNNPQLQDSWLASVKGLDLTGSSAQRQYIAALYWMMVTTTTVGYGDVAAGTLVEQVAVLGAVLCGVIFIAYGVNTLMEVMLEAALQDENAQRVALLRERANTLRLWGTWQDLPDHLMDSINRYSAGPWLTYTVIQRSWAAALGDIPPDLKGEMLWVMLVERQKELAPLSRRLIRGLPHACALALLALLEPQPLAPGQMLSWVGEQATHVWLLQEGEVVEMVGVLPTGISVDKPQLLAAHDLKGWLQQQIEPTGVKGSAAARGDGRGAHRHTGGHQCHHHHHASSSSRSTGEVGAAAGPAGISGEDLQAQDQGQQQQPGKEEEQQEEVGRPDDDTKKQSGAEQQEKQQKKQLRWSEQPSEPPARSHDKHDGEGDSIKLELAASWRYRQSLQASTICFLWGLPLSRLALALRSMPGLGENLMAELQRQQQQHEVEERARKSRFYARIDTA